FQAEDGIRDLYVTGVQTCALPISAAPPPPPRAPRSARRVRSRSVPAGPPPAGPTAPTASAAVAPRTRRCGRATPRVWPRRGPCRSEERRVGEEWRGGRSGEQ